MFRMEEFVSGMEQQLRNAVMKDVLTLLPKEESVSNMVPRSSSSSAVMRDAPIVPRKEEYVSGMALRGSSAAMKDVPTKLSMEMYVKGMVQSP